MADDASTGNGTSLPPKLDLRKTGVLKGHVFASPQQKAQEGAGAAAPVPSASVPPAARPAPPPSAPSTGVAPAAAAKPVAPAPAAPAAPAPAQSPRVKLSAPPPAGTVRLPVAGAPAAAAAVPAVPASGVRVAPPAAPASGVAAPGGGPPTVKAQPVTMKATPLAKKETARIPLEAASSDAGAAQGIVTAQPKTIRIQPVPSQSATAAAQAVPAAAGAEEGEAKRKTSRIPLDAALAATAEAGPSAGPKTIRLKRPADAATVRVAARPAAVPAAAAPESAAPAATTAGTRESLGKTSRLDVPPEESDAGGATATRRKTIRVKRPSQRQTVRGVTVARSEQPVAAAATGGAPAAGVPSATGGGQVETDAPGPFFGICAVAAIIVACVAIYVLCAQVFGPSVCLTRLSYGVPEMDLPWVGKVPVNR